MGEKLRRRVRARVLAGLTRAAGLVPANGVRRALEIASPLATFTRAERTTRANLELALGASTAHDERKRIARGVRRHAARLAAEWIRLARDDDPASAASAWIDDLVRFDASVERLERARAVGRGLIVATAHIGNWELLCARLWRFGLRGAVIGFDRPNDSTVRWLETMRAGYGVATLAQNVSPRDVLRLLSRGETIGILCDLEVRRLDGDYLPFFGVDALTMTAPAALARASGLAILPARCVLEGERYRLAFDEPLELDRSLEKHAAQRDLLVRLNATYERWIREHPEQWAWHQRRWRTRPGDVELLPLAEQRRRERARRIASGKPVAPGGSDASA